MKTLKISFLQSTPDFGREGMLQLLKSRYHVVEDDSDFDYLVATPWFYVNREAFYDFLERTPGHITVMYGCHEAIAPDFMLFDYYIGLDTVPGSDRTVKLPYLRHHLQEVHGGKEGCPCSPGLQNGFLQLHLRQPQIPSQPGCHVPQALRFPVRQFPGAPS